MKYSLIYHDKWSSLVMGIYDTYGEAILVMLKARMWLYGPHERILVRFEIWEVRDHA